MLGKRSPQQGLFDTDNLYLGSVGRDTFYGFVALNGDRLFWGEEFASLYCPDNGGKSVPPGVLARALVLQADDKVSDEEAVNRARYDMRWEVALGIAIKDRPFAKSTPQLFRAQLILPARPWNDKPREFFLTSLEEGFCLGGEARSESLLFVEHQRDRRDRLER